MLLSIEVVNKDGAILFLAMVGNFFLVKRIDFAMVGNFVLVKWIDFNSKKFEKQQQQQMVSECSMCT